MRNASGAGLYSSFRIRRSIIGLYDAVALPAIAITLLSLVMPAQSAGASTVTTLYSFCSEANCADGDSPDSLIQATDGNLYGTTFYGVSNGACPIGCGLLFKMTLSGTLTSLYSFCTESACPGMFPGGLLQAPDGNFYGDTYQGGARGDNGTLFRFSPNGSYTTAPGVLSSSIKV